MNEKLTPFWESGYQDMDNFTFSTAPNQTITELEPLFDKSWNILEVGCGEGQNSIYLAKQGFSNIDAFDISEHSIAKVKKICEFNKVTLNAYVADLTQYTFEKNYDLIMSFGTLHFVQKNAWKHFLTNAKKYTNLGGIHIIHLFTDTVPASADIAPFAIGLAKDEEIKSLYDDWEILHFKSYVFEDEHPNVPKHLHASNKLVARRIQ